MRCAQSGLQNPHLWPEDYAVLCALRGAILGAQKKRWAAGRHFARAFWAKPLRPDVVVLGSRMVYRDQLPYRVFPPVDWGLQREIRQKRFAPFNKLYLVQHRVIARQPCNFDMILLDWSDLALDQKAQRLLNDPSRLQKLWDALRGVDKIAEDDPRYQSLEAMLSVRMDQLPVPDAIDRTRSVVRQMPDAPLYHKRLADLYEADGDDSRARLSLADALACDPDNPFLVFAMGQFLIRNGATGQGEREILHAADLDDASAAIQGGSRSNLSSAREKGKSQEIP